MLAALILFLKAALAVVWRRLTGRATDTYRGWRVAVLVEFLRRSMTVLAEGSRPADPRKVAKFRRQQAAPPILGAARRRLRFRKTELGGVRTLEVVPRDGASGATLLYLHGGGYTLCSPETHRAFVASLVLRTGARALVPDYRLAPEHPYPAAVDDALAVYRMLLATGVEPRRLAIGGDSAGGGLTLALLLRLLETSEPLPRAAVLLSPWVDLTLSGKSLDAMAEHDYLTRQALRFFARSYLAETTPPEEPLVSPLFADLAGLPPLLIQLGGRELLVDEGRELAKKARAAGVDVTLQVWDDAAHAFPAFVGLMPEAREAGAEIARFLMSSTRPTAPAAPS